MSKRSVLLHLDADDHPSVFDRVVAVDAGVDVLLSHGSVKVGQVRDLVHGAIFTRGPKDLNRTALFVGGSNVEKAEELYSEARKHLLPQYGLRVSMMLDANGCNTTAVAAVRAVMASVPCSGARALVLAGTGPVGQRVVSLLARLGCAVRLASRQLDRAEAAARAIMCKRPGAAIEAVAPANAFDMSRALEDCDILVACGAAGIRLVDHGIWSKKRLKVVVDLNGVPPMGIEGIEPFDSGVEREGAICHGALGVGGFKMKLHKACISSLFETNQLELEEDAIFDRAVILAGG